MKRNRQRAKNYKRIKKEWEWMKQHRQELKNIIGEKCQNCGTTKNIQYHHTSYNQEKPLMQRLQALCTNCHQKQHPNKRIDTHEKQEEKQERTEKPKEELEDEQISKQLNQTCRNNIQGYCVETFHNVNKPTNYTKHCSRKCTKYQKKQ